TDVPPGFDLRVELYSCCVEEEFSMGFSSRRLSRLGSSSSKNSFLRFPQHSPGGDSPVLLPALSVR
ncbi:hypothetical protein M9458_042533, partial [Cirrhinus mrigala]